MLNEQARGVLRIREDHHPRTGSGHGERRFGWSTLVLEQPAGFSAPTAGVAPKA